MADDVMSYDSKCDEIQVYGEQELCVVQSGEYGNNGSTPKKVDKRPRETEDSSEDGFTTVARRKSKRHIRTESYENDRSFSENNENMSGTYYEVSLFGLQILPKQMAFARLLRDENISNVLKIKYKSPYKIFIQFSDKNQAEKFMNLKKLTELDIRAQFTNQGNLSYGIIKGVDVGTSEKELLENLKCDYDIISARRLKRVNKEGKWVESETVRLCFKNPFAPLSIYAYGFKFDVERFEFPVSRCSGCWSFGHIKRFCKLNKNICPKCGGAHDNCEIKEYKCINCKGPHMALDKSCPFFRKEKKIRFIMSENNVTYKTALEIYLKNQKEEKANNSREEVDIDLDRSNTVPVSESTTARSYSSVLKTTAIVHGKEKKDEQSDNIIINENQNKDKKKKRVKKTDNMNNSESQNERMDYDGSQESDQDTQDESTEKARTRKRNRFDFWKLFNRIKEIVLSEENWCDKVMLVVRAVFEECKLFLVNFLSEGKLYDVFSKFLFNG
ncbi:uncharacterized protein LOC123878745 [Maniola jurtina]|uniref:uncharacterized protein LOC123866428 n=1 Tax=Maniola jurtina TaxID=191418 RepID=UPI001E68950C|nr:uncharacterized protein LOC123866428 [Maniola jurtina]XP_045769106.1 uncharacterized protein LOC123870003 [Maniola jurtina]XP_045775810.1 uncharacterized protein LOC123874469 [Maniola jurtina]XP_045780558.1 uncharacterized protein LOC123877740 [Maniola jurtina]XP_045781679.1 uncharacterized protein LOC123878513 [Maniola jurtina]XP_045782000.1 uncharacterized protein LOC123878745 [Maniola jurtina]